MIDRKAMLISGCLLVALFGSGLAAWVLLPLDPAVRSFFFAPAAASVMWGFFLALRRMDPRRGGEIRPFKAESRMLYVPALLMGVVQFFVLTRAFGVFWGTPRLIVAAIGLTWVIQGNVMGKLRPGHPLGMRNPWTSADARVWDQTHRFGGWLMVLTGAATIAIALTMPRGWPMLATVLALPIAAILVVLAHSWNLWRRLHPGEPSLPMNGGTLSMVVGLIILIAISADFALEQGRSGGLIGLTAVLAVLGLRYFSYRRQRH